MDRAGRHRRRPAPPEEAAVFQLTVLYNHPEDPAEFDRYYDGVHAPLASKLPGLQRYTMARPGPGMDGSAPAYHLVAVLDWEDEAAFGAAVQSEQGQAVLADVPNFAGAGYTMLAGTATPVV
jgi:uncharacterized protein (TIGR02118 family)